MRLFIPADDWIEGVLSRNGCFELGNHSHPIHIIHKVQNILKCQNNERDYVTYSPYVINEVMKNIHNINFDIEIYLVQFDCEGYLQYLKLSDYVIDEVYTSGTDLFINRSYWNGLFKVHQTTKDIQINNYRKKDLIDK